MEKFLKFEEGLKTKCPFCGEVELSYKYKITVKEGWDKVVGWVACINCRAQGPITVAQGDGAASLNLVKVKSIEKWEERKI